MDGKVRIGDGKKHTSKKTFRVGRDLEFFSSFQSFIHFLSTGGRISLGQLLQTGAAIKAEKWEEYLELCPTFFPHARICKCMCTLNSGILKLQCFEEPWMCLALLLLKIMSEFVCSYVTGCMWDLSVWNTCFLEYSPCIKNAFCCTKFTLH